MKKIGIMGGTFNPIHNGHLYMAKKAYEQFKLDQVWFMPTKNPPHKEEKEILPDSCRCQMIALALEGFPYFSLSTLELQREGMTYTKDTLEEVSKKYPGHYFYFIIGSDSLAYIDEWKEAVKLLSMAHILSAPRHPSSPRKDREKKAFLEKQFGADIQFISMEAVAISSQQIRDKIQKGESAQPFLPEKVFQYITANGLYRKGGAPLEPNVLELQEQMRSCLTKKRYAHTIGVQHTAACLAMRYGEEVQKASLAGLLHDCAKCLPEQEILKECKAHNIEMSPLEERNPYLLHGKLGAYYAEAKYGVLDREIHQAIRFHTTGRPEMSLLEKIIFIADYMEPLRREIPGLAAIRSTVFLDIDKAVYMALDNTLNYLRDTEHGRKKEIDDMTIRAYQYYKGGESNE